MKMKLSIVLLILGSIAVSRNGAAAAGNDDASAPWLGGSTADSVKNKAGKALAFLQAFMKSNWVEDAGKGMKDMGGKLGEATRDVSMDAGEAFLKVSEPLHKIMKTAVEKGKSAIDNADMHKELRKIWEDASSTLGGQIEGLMAVDYERAAYELGKGIHKVEMAIKDAGGRISDVGSKVDGMAEEALAKKGAAIKKFMAALVEGLKAYASSLGEKSFRVMKEIEGQASHVEATEKTTEEAKRHVGDGVGALRGAADKINKAILSGYQESKDENGGN